MLTDDLAFIDTLDDLRKRCVLRATEYDTVQAAGLIRRLLLDTTPLAHVVNRAYRLELLFRWNLVYQTMGLDPELMTMGLLMDPDLIAVRTAEFRPDGWTPPSQEGNLRQFLAARVVRDGQDSRWATVGDLLGHYANRLGGVHWDPNSNKASDNSTLREAFAEYEANLRLCMSSIGRIVVRALDPLAAKAYLASLPPEKGGTNFG